jgi:DNA repair protein RadD
VPTSSEQNNLEATCPNCGSIIPLEPPVEGFGGEKPEVVNDESIDLEEIAIGTNSEIMAEIMKLKAIQVTRNYKPFWIYHQIINTYPEIGLGELRELGKLLKYHPRWAWHKWCELQSQGEKKSA